MERRGEMEGKKRDTNPRICKRGECRHATSPLAISLVPVLCVVINFRECQLPVRRSGRWAGGAPDSQLPTVLPIPCCKQPLGPPPTFSHWLQQNQQSFSVEGQIITERGEKVSNGEEQKNHREAAAVQSRLVSLAHSLPLFTCTWRSHLSLTVEMMAAAELLHRKKKIFGMRFVNQSSDQSEKKGSRQTFSQFSISTD